MWIIEFITMWIVTTGISIMLLKGLVKLDILKYSNVKAFICFIPGFNILFYGIITMCFMFFFIMIFVLGVGDYLKLSERMEKFFTGK